jgi:hypothetical protein
MKLVLAFFALSLLSGCNSNKDASTHSYMAASKGEKEECVEPENPYTDGSGHFAGWRWAEENGVSRCGGNSSSFIEGCEEYLNQQERFTECENINNEL